MSEMICDKIDLAGSGPAPGQKGNRSSAAQLLSLAATPTFAIMALLAAVHGGSMPDMHCAAAGDGWPLTGMAAMYLLMSAFHLPPWLSLLATVRETPR
jgi:hypothetical protein